jgi:hypothetical protein
VVASLKFLFYFGWLRVAESLYNPFGDDDEDFEMDELLDRHLRVGSYVVEAREEPPVLLEAGNTWKLAYFEQLRRCQQPFFYKHSIT